MSTLAEKIENLIGICRDPKDEATLLEILSDVRELERRIGIAETAIECASGIIDYCAGDAWERECTEDARNTFSSIYSELFPQPLIPTAIREDDRGWLFTETLCPECRKPFKDEMACQQHRRDKHGIDFNDPRPSAILSRTSETLEASNG